MEPRHKKHSHRSEVKDRTAAVKRKASRSTSQDHRKTVSHAGTEEKRKDPDINVVELEGYRDQLEKVEFEGGRDQEKVELEGGRDQLEKVELEGGKDQLEKVELERGIDQLEKEENVQVCDITLLAPNPTIEVGTPSPRIPRMTTIEVETPSPRIPRMSTLEVGTRLYQPGEYSNTSRRSKNPAGNSRRQSTPSFWNPGPLELEPFALLKKRGTRNCNLQASIVGGARPYGLTVYRWLTIQATIPQPGVSSVSFVRAVCSLLAGLIFTLLIMTTATAIILGMTLPVCLDYTDCLQKVGPQTVCIPTRGRLQTMTMEPARCTPCTWWLGILKNESALDPVVAFIEPALVSPIDYLLAAPHIKCTFCADRQTWADVATMHCNREAIPGDIACPPLHKTARMVWHFTIIIIIMCLFVWSRSAMEEVEDAISTYQIQAVHLAVAPGKHVLLTLARVGFMFRCSLVCILGTGALALLLNSGVEPSSIMLDLVGLSFLTSVDSVVPAVMLSRDVQDSTLAKFRRLRERSSEGRSHFIMCRVYVGLVCTGVTVAVSYPFLAASLRLGIPIEEISCLDAAGYSVIMFLVMPSLVICGFFYYDVIWRFDDMPLRKKLRTMVISCLTMLFVMVLTFVMWVACLM